MPAEQLWAVIIGLPGEFRSTQLELDLSANGYDVQRYNGFDGRELTARSMRQVVNQRGAKLLLRRPMTGGEVGCAMSHRGALALGQLQGRDWIIVLEDDAELALPNTRELLEALESVPAGPAVVLLYTMPNFAYVRPGLRVNDSFRLHRAVTPPMGATAYAVNRAGLELIKSRDHGRVQYVADWPPSWCYDVGFYVLDPQPFRLNQDARSTLEDRRLAAVAREEPIAVKVGRHVWTALGLRYLQNSWAYTSYSNYWQHEIRRPLLQALARRVGRPVGAPGAPRVLSSWWYRL